MTMDNIKYNNLTQPMHTMSAKNSVSSNARAAKAMVNDGIQIIIGQNRDTLDSGFGRNMHYTNATNTIM